MKPLQLIRQFKLGKIVVIIFLVIAFFVGLSHIGTSKHDVTKIEINPIGFNKAFGLPGPTVGWDGVRAVATIVRAIGVTFNTLYDNIKSWGNLSKTSLSVDMQLPVVPYYISVRINQATQDVQGSVDGSAVTYANRVQLKYPDSAGSAVFQLFFNDPDDSGSGALMYVKPYYFEAMPGTLFNSSGIFEVEVQKSGSDKIMYVSFNGNPWVGTSLSYPVSGRFKLVDTGTEYDITSLTYVHKDGLSVVNSICPLSGPTSGEAFYTLAFITTHDSPYYSTAMWGWENDGKSENLCTYTPNPYNYGHFNASVTGGFVCDGLSTSCPDGSPYPLDADVNTLYTNMATGVGQEFNATVISSLSLSVKAFNP